MPKVGKMIRGSVIDKLRQSYILVISDIGDYFDGGTNLDFLMCCIFLLMLHTILLPVLIVAILISYLLHNKQFERENTFKR